MKKIFLVLAATLFCLTGVFAQENFSKKATVEPLYTQKGDGKEYCPICGMDLKMHYKTVHMAKLKDGTNRQYCSIRCLIEDRKSKEVDMTTVKVIDAKSQKVIDAKSAYYVVGANAPTTMLPLSLYAFKDGADAREFRAEFGGEIKTFDEVYEQVTGVMQTSEAARQSRLEKNVYPKGQKLYESKCKEINPSSYENIAKLKADLKNYCDIKDPMQFQPIALYLWDVKREKNSDESFSMSVTKEDRCPVCAMFVSKYPEWVAKVEYDGGYYAFDGVKDMMKFVFDPKKYAGKEIKIKRVLVTDYYNQKGIDATKAYYVIGSDVYGPMGNELIPFSSKKEAQNFRKDHKGSDVLSYQEITKSIVCQLDGLKCD